ncbi:AMP-binding protein [Denitromonas sp.]|uniref:AMP-binding protein n=1 Tax=Denitromonas sp. TaxID=2734609 RepID=UPI003A8C0B64
MSQGNLFARFEQLALETPEATLIETADGGRYTYQDMLDVTGRFAATLMAGGVQPGDRVAAQVEKSVDAFFLYLATLRAGAIYLPLNTAYKNAELAFFLEDAEPRVFLCDPAGADEKQALAAKHGVQTFLTLSTSHSGSFLAQAEATTGALATVQRDGEDVAAIIYTSGTTGRPKGAMLTHTNLLSNGQTLTRLWGFNRDDVLLHALPLFHAHGLFISSHCVLLSGSRMLFLPKYKAEEVLGLLPRATVMAGVPTFYTRLLELDGFDRQATANMRLFISGSAPLLPETARAFEARTGHRILERYGMTESVIIASNPFVGERRIGSVGQPIDGVDVRIAGENNVTQPAGTVGEVQIRGSGVMKGYWRNPEKTAADMTDDGWFRTGDLGTLSADGYLDIVGRAKDLVITGGYNVYPKEVEMVIDALPGVHESAVIGLPDSDFGEAVTAVVVPAGEAIDAAEVIGHVKATLANYKVPKQVFFVDILPRNAMGKVMKNELRARYEKQAR